MADNSDPVMQNQDVIQGARAIRTSPALLAALMAPPTAAPASDDPNVAALATHNEPGAQGGKTVARSKPSTALASALASAPAAAAPLPPIRPTDPDAINALASPPGASSPMDPSIAARAAAASSSPSQTSSAIANPPIDAAVWRERDKSGPPNRQTDGVAVAPYGDNFAYRGRFL